MGPVVPINAWGTCSPLMHAQKKAMCDNVGVVMGPNRIVGKGAYMQLDPRTMTEVPSMKSRYRKVMSATQVLGLLRPSKWSFPPVFSTLGSWAPFWKYSYLCGWKLRANNYGKMQEQCSRILSRRVQPPL